MPKAIPAVVIAQMDKVKKRPVLLFELGLSSTIRFCAYRTNITFPAGGNVYVAKAIQISGIEQSIEGQIGRVTLQFDNVIKDMAAYANAENFKGKSLIVKRIYLDSIVNATDYNEVFNGYMERVDRISRLWLTVNATTGMPLKKKALSFAYQRMCPWIFGNTECNTDGLANLAVLTASGTADSGTTSTLVDNALTQAEGHWNNGEIQITKSGIVYYRRVKSFSAASDQITLDVELPVAIDATCTYVVYKGCDKTWDTCGAANAWGPSANNQLNFGGCIHISAKADAEG